MGIPEWLTAVATAVIAGATIVYVIVTRKLWKATLVTAQRTQELVQQSQEALRLQLILAFLEETRPLLTAGTREPPSTGIVNARVKEARLLLATSFPVDWPKIEQIIERMQQQMKTHWVPPQKES